MSPRKGTQKSAKSSTATGKTSKGFTAEERAAMKERAHELKAEARRGSDQADGERAALAQIAAMQEPDRALAQRLHALIKASAPALSSKAWYGMPAYAKDGKVVCFFQNAQKCKSRYAIFGFSDETHLDEGAMWPTSFAPKRVDRRRGGADRRTREESGELRTDRASGPLSWAVSPPAGLRRRRREAHPRRHLKRRLTGVGSWQSAARLLA